MTEFVALDVETANAFMGSICQIGVVRFSDGQPVEALSTLIDPECEFDGINTAIHGIDERMVEGAPLFSEVWPQLAAFAGNMPVVHHTHFDRVSIQQACAASSIAAPRWTWLDTAKVARRTWPDVAQRGYGLAPLAERLGITFSHHDAAEDARACGMILCGALRESGRDLADWFALVEQPITSQDARRVGSGSGPLAGERIVFTGALQMTRGLAADRAQALGADVANTLTESTTILVVGNQDLTKLAGHSKSSKHRKAEGLAARGHPIRIVAEADFLAF